MKLRFNKMYALIGALLFLVEVTIALFVRDRFVRPFVGDVLVVLLLYACARSWVDVTRPRVLAVAVLLFSYLVEVGQYFDLVSILGLEGSGFAAVVIGTAFDWRDLLSYTVGFALILAWEGARNGGRAAGRGGESPALNETGGSDGTRC